MKEARATSLSTGWNLISFPYASVSSTSGFSGVIYYHDGSSYKTVDPSSNPSSIDTTAAHWVNSSGGAQVSSAGPENTGNLNKRALKIGWNFVGCPSSSDLPLKNMSITSGGITKSLDDASSLDTTSSTTSWLYENILVYSSGYAKWASMKDSSAVLSPTRGYVIWSWKDCELNLNVSVAGQPSISQVTPAKAKIGDQITIQGTRFGTGGAVFIGGIQVDPVTITQWNETTIICQMPAGLEFGTKNLLVITGGIPSNRPSFQVLASPIVLTGPVGTSVQNAWDFMKREMMNPQGGVYTNFEPNVPNTALYPYGHNVSAEHMGLLLWCAAIMNDKTTFEKAYSYVKTFMVDISNKDVVNWACTTTNAPLYGRGEAGANLLSNAPLDDFRVVRGLFSGYDVWGDQKYLDLALKVGQGLRKTSVTTKVTLYPGGLVAYAFNWQNNTDPGKTDINPIPIDYADLYVMKRLAETDPGWTSAVTAHAKLKLDSQLPVGLHWNALDTDKNEFAGDFEFVGNIRGTKIKAIQTLWIGIHLARLGYTEQAKKQYDFLKNFYSANGRIPEYFETNGTLSNLDLVNGEPRIYSQAVRLGLLLGERDFPLKLITEKIIPTQRNVHGTVDPVRFPTADLYGCIGFDPASPWAEAWNNLESIVGMGYYLGSPLVGPYRKTTP